MEKFFPKDSPLLLIVVIIIIALVPSYYFYNQYQSAKQLLGDSGLPAKEEVKKVVDEVSKLMELPTGEEPTLATVSDKTKLQNQAFFAKAENGDKVLVYVNAKKAILYRPSENKIIEVAPVNLTATQQAQPTPSPKTIKVAIYNGTTTPGLTSSVEKKIKAKIPTLEVVAKVDAKKKDYAKTLLIDLSGNSKNEIQQLNSTLSAQISSLPAGEAKPNADILIIAGKDFLY
ncbi:LytR C-terminal domain-containing protein [Patescibacteria group bacterium]|nr:LytR C-terminal domain-containing protein [Patescibacteria group bacterium]